MTEEEYEQAAEALYEEFLQERARYHAELERIEAEYMAASAAAMEWEREASAAVSAQYVQRIIPIEDARKAAEEAAEAEWDKVLTANGQQWEALAEKHGGAA